MINFTNLADRSIRYQTDVLKQGEIGGYCDFNRDRLENELDHMSALQSWAPELRNFRKLADRPGERKMCDMYVDKPTFIMKVDAGNFKIIIIFYTLS